MRKKIRYLYLSILLCSGLIIEKLMGFWFSVDYILKHRRLPRKPCQKEREALEHHLKELLNKDRISREKTRK